MKTLIEALIVGIIGLGVIYLLSGCASTYTMKNCTPKDKPFWECEKP